MNDALKPEADFIFRIPLNHMRNVSAVAMHFPVMEGFITRYSIEQEDGRYARFSFTLRRTRGVFQDPNVWAQRVLDFVNDNGW